MYPHFTSGREEEKDDTRSDRDWAAITVPPQVAVTQRRAVATSPAVDLEGIRDHSISAYFITTTTTSTSNPKCLTTTITSSNSSSLVILE